MDYSKQNVAVLFAHKHLKLDISRRTEVINESVLTFTLEKKEVHAFKKKNDNQYDRKVQETFSTLTLQTVCVCQCTYRQHIKWNNIWHTCLYQSKVLKNTILSFNCKYLRENDKVHTNSISTVFFFALLNCKLSISDLWLSRTCLFCLNHFDFLKKYQHSNWDFVEAFCYYWNY